MKKWSKIIIFLLTALLVFGHSQNKDMIYNIPKIDDLKIDGVLADWQNRGLNIPLYADRYGNRTAPSDFSTDFTLAWNERGMFLAIRVSDDVFYENPDINRLWSGDCIEIFMAGQKGANDYIQFIISPGMTNPHPELRDQSYDHRKSAALKKIPLEITVARTRKMNGYQLEAFLPFSQLDIHPKLGREMAFQIYLTDFDEKTGKNSHHHVWYYQWETHANPAAMQRIRLAETATRQVLTTVKAGIEDAERLYVEVYADPVLAGKLVRVQLDGKSLFSGKLTKKQDVCGYTGFTPLSSAENGESLQVLVAGDTVDQFDINYLPYRYVNRKPYPFEPEIQHYEFLDKKNPSPQNAILFVGSSSIRMWKTLEKDMAPLTVINRGFGGSQAEHVVHFFDRIVLPYHPKAIVFYEGDNDIAVGKSPEEILTQTRIFSDKVHQALPNARIYFLSIKPSFARYHLWETMRQANALLKNYAQQHDFLTFIDISEAMHDSDGKLRQDIFSGDGLHMNERGYKIWTDIIKTRLLMTLK